MKRTALYCFLILTGCTTGVNMRSVNYEHLLHDSNSKVWMVNKVMLGNAVISPDFIFDKDLLIFYTSGNINLIPMRSLTREKGEGGFFILNSEERRLTLELDRSGRWVFDMAYITEDSILLQPTNKSDTNISLQLIPFPEF